MLFNSSVSIGNKSDGRVFIAVYIEGKRYRFSNGEALDLDIKPNRYIGSSREKEALALEAAFRVALRKGWLPDDLRQKAVRRRPSTLLELLDKEVNQRLLGDYSRSYKMDLRSVVRQFKNFLTSSNLTQLPLRGLTTSLLRDFLDSRQVGPRSKRNMKAYLSSIYRPHLDEAGLKNPFSTIRLPKTSEVLHKPFSDVPAILAEVYQFDRRLHLCCLLAYCCLLRPHREIRELVWGDFNDDLSVIALSGSRNKGKRNRIVPVPEYAKSYLESMRTDSSSKLDNIFTNSPKPFNFSYFGTLWGRFKQHSNLLEPDQTLYSLRHGGALKVFEQTGSLVKLQQVMGHSSLQVSLTYLRGLEVSQLNLADMPSLEM